MFVLLQLSQLEDCPECFIRDLSEEPDIFCQPCVRRFLAFFFLYYSLVEAIRGTPLFCPISTRHPFFVNTHKFTYTDINLHNYSVLKSPRARREKATFETAKSSLMSAERPACAGVGAREGLSAVARQSALHLLVLVGGRPFVALWPASGARRARRQRSLLWRVTRARDAGARAVSAAVARGARPGAPPDERVRARGL